MSLFGLAPFPQVAGEGQDRDLSRCPTTTQEGGEKVRTAPRKEAQLEGGGGGQLLGQGGPGLAQKAARSESRRREGWGGIPVRTSGS